jgi:4'-phosphopantetheinyl transferase
VTRSNTADKKFDSAGTEARKNLVFQLPPWPSPPDSLLLPELEVHAWRISLDQSSAFENELFEILAFDERERANRFHFARDRSHFIVARGFLRQLLGRYLRTSAREILFDYSAYGKPALAGDYVGSGLRFNVSHSHGVALYALMCNCEIGVDVEHIRDDFNVEEIARRFFSRGEVEALVALPADEWIPAFFRCWTRKEAFIKATGKGLSQSLDEFDVTVAPGEPAALLRLLGEPDASSRWSLRDLELGSRFGAALAIERSAFALQCWQGLIQ